MKQSVSQLKEELKSNLHDARVVRSGDYAKAVTKGVAGGVGELSMIEDFECLSAELHIDLLADGELTEKRQVGVVDTRTIEKATMRVAEGSELLRCSSFSVENSGRR